MKNILEWRVMLICESSPRVARLYPAISSHFDLADDQHRRIVSAPRPEVG
jgi:hypothetical protein